MASFESQSDRVREQVQPENITTTKTALPADAVDDGSESRRKRAKKRISPVWEHFTVITKVHNGVAEQRAQCKHCLKDYAYDSHKHGTASYNRHTQVCLRTPRPGNHVEMRLGSDGNLIRRKHDHVVFRDMLARCVIEHDLPFSFVECNRVKLLMKYLNPDVECISKKTVASDVFKMYELEKQKLKLELSEIPGRISFTSDLWTAITVEGYMCLTAHYIDKNWHLQNRILAFVALPPPHTGMDMAMKVLDIWRDWGIEKKVFSITLDNTSNNDSMQNILKKHLALENDLFCNGQYFHIRCCVHILNLIVQKGLKVIQPSLQKIRDSVKYVQSSESHKRLFRTCVTTTGLKIRAGLVLDVPTRWNSTYKMLARGLQYRKAFDRYKVVDPNYTFQLTEEEWELGTEIAKLLQPFDEITTMFSGSTYPTANLYFMQVYKIKYWLSLHENSGEYVIADMVNTMKQQVENYWHEYSHILAIAAVLDPRFKMDLLKFVYSNLSMETSTAEIAKVQASMKALFSAYKGVSTPSPLRDTTTSQESLEIEEQGQPFITYADFLNFRQKKVEASGKSALDVYLEEPPIDMEVYANLCVLDYWKDNAVRFGELSMMACDILSIPITTVASESSFSIGSRVLNKYRSSLLPKNVQALLCSRSWLHGFTPYDNELEAFDVNLDEASTSGATCETPTESIVGSNVS